MRKVMLADGLKDVENILDKERLEQREKMNKGYILGILTIFFLFYVIQSAQSVDKLHLKLVAGGVVVTNIIHYVKNVKYLIQIIICLDALFGIWILSVRLKV